MKKKKRLKKIRDLLLEMGAGKFFYRVERSGKNDTVEALVSVINMMAEEIEEALVHQGYANANETIKHIVLMSFLIDSKGKVEAVSQKSSTILLYLCKDIIQKPFDSFLDDTSTLKWKGFLEYIKKQPVKDTSLELTFKTKEGLFVPSACYVNILEDKVGGTDQILLTVVKHSKKQVELEVDLKHPILHLANKPEKQKDKPINTTGREKVRLSKEDIRKIGKARDLLIHNLDKDFPPIKDFALQVGTNAFKLKYGFKELYGTSVFRFLRNERLRKAKMLVQYGDRRFKMIAQLCGFKSVPHFTRSFKKQFGHTPTELRNISTTEDS